MATCCYKQHVISVLLEINDQKLNSFMEHAIKKFEIEEIVLDLNTTTQVPPCFVKQHKTWT